MASIEVHDPDFKTLLTIPLSCVIHVPPAHMDISRFVLCKNFDAKRPKTSCTMGDSCKFVHANLAGAAIQQQEIHVNYAWREERLVTYERLPAGETLSVLAPNNRYPVELIPSELVLATRGAVARHHHGGQLSHCAHYYFNRMCNRGDRCNFIHAVYIDPSATDFQRAPPRAGAGNLARDPASLVKPLPRSPSETTSCSLSDSGSAQVSPRSDDETQPRRYRHNPYSLLYVTLPG
jgi:hypothetical protein